MAPSEATAALLFDSAVLVGVRAGLFLACRRFLQATLSPALRRVSKPGQDALVPLLGSAEDDDEDSATPFGSPSPSHRGSPLVHPNGLPFSTTSRDSYARQPSDLNLPGQIAHQPSSSTPSPGPGSTRRTPSGGFGGDGNKNVIHVHQTAEEMGRSSKGGESDAERKKNLYGKAARAIFSLAFSESCMLFVLVFFSAVGILHPRSRKIHWDFSLNLLLVLLLIVTPLVQSFLVTRYRSSRDAYSYTSLGTSRTSGSKRKKVLLRRTAVALVPFSLSTFLFTCVPVPSSMVLTDTGVITACLARLSVLGVLVLGALSGFGSITTAFQFFGRMAKSHWQPISNEDVIAAERSLFVTRQDLLAKREEVRRRGASGEGAAPSWRSRVFGGMLGGGDDEGSSLDLEIRGLEMMERQVAKQITAMRERKERMEFSSTWRGKASNSIGYLFAAYCVCRLLMAAFNLFIMPRITSSPSLSAVMSSPSSMPATPAQPHSDWISYLVATALSHLPFDIDVAVWSRQISLAMVGIIIGSSVQYVMKWVAKALRLGSASVGGVVLLLGLGQLMTMYLLSLLIQLRTSLPAEESSDPDSLLASTLPSFTAFNTLFDLAYLVAALATLVISWLDEKINKADGDPEVWRMGDV